MIWGYHYFWKHPAHSQLKSYRWFFLCALSFDGVLSTANFREVAADYLEEDEPMERDLPDTLFHTRKRSPMMDELKQIVRRLTWTSLAPMAFNALPAEQALMMDSFAAGTMEKMPGCWRSEILIPGLVCRNKSWPKGDWFQSCGVWPGGHTALLLPMQKEVVGKNLVFWSVKPLHRKDLRWAHVHTFADWEVLPTETTSPLHFHVFCLLLFLSLIATSKLQDHDLICFGACFSLVELRTYIKVT